MNQADVTVVIPVYNQEKYIKQCVESVYANKCSVEIIVLNDGSTDSTAEILKSLSPPSHVRLVLLEQENTANMGYNMHKLYSMASGKYISEIGSDDYYLLGALDTLVQTMEGLPKEIGFIYSGYMSIRGFEEAELGDTSKTSFSHVPAFANSYYQWKNDPHLRLLQNNFVTPPCLLRRELYGNPVKYDEEQKFCEDYLFKLELSRVTQFYQLPKYLSMIRIRSTSISNNPNARTEMRPWEDRARQKVKERYGY